MAHDQDAQLFDKLKNVSTATLTGVLHKLGIRNSWLNGPRPLSGSQKRVVGRAFTLRFIPGRDDLATQEAWTSGTSTRAAIEAMPADCIAVIDSAGVSHSAILGDLLVRRMWKRNVAALVTDGLVRDADAIRDVPIPVWCAGAAAPASIPGLTFVGWNQPIGCGGIAVLPNDIIVADGDGAVVVPTALAAQVAELALEREQLDAWIADRLDDGEGLIGLYPPDAANQARYENSKQNKS